MNLRKLNGLWLLAAGLATAQAVAQTREPNATLGEVRGAVTVSQPGQRQAGRVEQRLRPGQRVDAPARGRARIKYDDGCTVDVDANKFSLVGERSPCACAAGNGDEEKQRQSPLRNDAWLRELTGRVMVNEGRDFQNGREGQQVKEGDRVMVGGQSRAILEFFDGCRVEIDADKLIEIPENSPCACGVLAQQNMQPGQIGAPGVAGPAAATPPGLLVPLITAGAVILLLDNDDASP